jgi:hypothetical protein
VKNVDLGKQTLSLVRVSLSGVNLQGISGATISNGTLAIRFSTVNLAGGAPWTGTPYALTLDNVQVYTTGAKLTLTKGALDLKGSTTLRIGNTSSLQVNNGTGIPWGILDSSGGNKSRILNFGAITIAQAPGRRAAFRFSIGVGLVNGNGGVVTVGVPVLVTGSTTSYGNTQFEVLAGATLDLAGPNNSFLGNTELQGPGETILSGNASIATRASVTAEHLSIENKANLALDGTLKVAPGVTLFGLPLLGYPNLEWSSGAITGQGTLTVMPFATMSVPNPGGANRELLQGVTVSNFGKLEVNGARLDVKRAVIDNFGFMSIVGGLTSITDRPGFLPLRSKIINRGVISLSGAGAAGPNLSLTVINYTATAILYLVSGTVTIADYQHLAGRTFLATGTTLTVPAGLRIQSGSILSGFGTIVGNLINEGMVSPGWLPAEGPVFGTLTIQGSYQQSTSGNLVIKASGSGTNFTTDQLVVSGIATVAGTITFSPAAFTPPGPTTALVVVTASSVKGSFTALQGFVVGAYVLRTDYYPTAAPTQVRIVQSGLLAPAPTLTALSTSTGSTAGGTTIVVSGTDFTDTYAVLFNGVPALGFTVNSSTSVTAISPPLATGTYDIRVVTTYIPLFAPGHFR